jgi:ATP-binding cassette, subfamily B, bacterial MsbA
MMYWLLGLFGIGAENGDFPLIKRIVRDHAGRHWPGYALAISMMFLVAGCNATAAYLIGNIVNATFLKQEFAAIVLLSLIWCALFATRGFATYGQDVFIARVANKITAETQRKLADNLLKQGVSYFADRHSTDVMTNAVWGSNAIANSLNQIVLAFGRDAFQIVSLVAVMIWTDPVMAAFGLSIMPPALIGVERLVARARALSATRYAGSGQMLSTMQEVGQGFKIIKAFNVETAFSERIDGNIKHLERSANKLAQVANWSSPLVEAFGGIAVGMACLYCGHKVLNAGGAPGEFVSFMLAFILTFDPARRLARLKVDLANNLVMARSLYGFFDGPATEPDDSHKAEIKSGPGRIEFRDVNFEYQPGVPVLHNLSFVAEPGTLTALVGPSGAGKTTILNLLLRFYDAQSGAVYVDGQNICDVKRRSLRAHISYVGQDVYLFAGTIRENLLIGKPEATHDEVAAASRAAYAHDFISSFPDGYDSQVGELGSKLSSGQRQRLAIARAFLKNAPIVLLDEPTGSLDSESERHVQEAIRTLCEGKTTLAIAHRLNTITDADRIFVIERGTVIESGRHERLLEQNGRYATFFRFQFQ